MSVLGHVDHGKTSVLDHFRSLGSERQASVMDREAGGITQHIGATELSAKILNETCAAMTGGKDFNSPGLLFIDTPGHHSFTSLRSRGGALADIAILVVDIMEGLQPQTIESLRILRDKKTPFVVAANKVDRIHGWRTEKDVRSSNHGQTKERTSTSCSKRDTGNFWASLANTDSISKDMTRFVTSNPTWQWCHVLQKMVKACKTY